MQKNYLLQTYIVTSKPKRNSVADGFVHIMRSPFNKICNTGITSIIILLMLQFINNGELVYGK